MRPEYVFFYLSSADNLTFINNYSLLGNNTLCLNTTTFRSIAKLTNYICCQQLFYLCIRKFLRHSHSIISTSHTVFLITTFLPNFFCLFKQKIYIIWIQNNFILTTCLVAHVVCFQSLPTFVNYIFSFLLFEYDI